MSIVTLQIGQCGNQIGQAFYSFMNQESKQASEAHQAMVNDTFFFNNNDTKQIQYRGNDILTPKSILIDMEPKVVDHCLSNKYTENDTFQYDKEFTYCKQEGSGNNWSYGHNQHGQKCKDDILDKINKMLEKIDFCQGFMVMQSVAGGTGSGLGSYIVEELFSSIPNIPILNLCIMPHLTGEVILQSYNCTLTLNSLYQNSNGIILIENDYIQQICNKLLKIKSPSLHEMNQVITQQLTSLFFPVLKQQKQQYFSSLQNDFQIIQDINETLLLDPKYKLLTLQNVPQMPDSSISFNNDQWLALDKRLMQMQISNSTEDQINWSIKPGNQNAYRSISNLVIYRGSDAQTKLNIKQSQLLNPHIYKDQRILFKGFVDSHNLNKQDRSISCLSNNQQVVKSLEQILERTHKMFSERAYIYQYQKYGTQESDFIEAIAICEQILANYKSF